MIKNSIFDQTFDFRSNIRFSIKHSIFDQKYDFRSKIRFSIKHSIFDQTFDSGYILYSTIFILYTIFNSDESDGANVCFGSSAAPLICVADNKPVLTGLVSWGQGCDESNRPTVYAEISQFIDWMTEVVGGKKSKTSTYGILSVLIKHKIA